MSDKGGSEAEVSAGTDAAGGAARSRRGLTGRERGIVAAAVVFVVVAFAAGATLVRPQRGSSSTVATRSSTDPAATQPANESDAGSVVAPQTSSTNVPTTVSLPSAQPDPAVTTPAASAGSTVTTAAAKPVTTAAPNATTTGAPNATTTAAPQPTTTQAPKPTTTTVPPATTVPPTTTTTVPLSQPASCRVPEGGEAEVLTQADFETRLEHAWQLCSAPSVFGTNEAGLEIRDDHRWSKLVSTAAGLVRAQGWGNEGTWASIDAGVGYGGRWQLNLSIDGSGTVITQPVFATSVAKIRLNNEGLFIGDYVQLPAGSVTG